MAMLVLEGRFFDTKKNDPKHHESHPLESTFEWFSTLSRD